MAYNWDELKAQHERLQQELLSANLDPMRRQVVQKEDARLSSILEIHEQIVDCEQTITQTQQLFDENTDADMADLYEQELADLRKKLALLNRELEDAMFPPDERDNRSIFLEIRAGAGGQEAALFAADLARMYTNYALAQGWQVSVISTSQTELKGFKEVVLYIQGKGAYGHLKFESGVHRVQRVPETETSGRIHTSTATVAVLPEAKEVEFSVDPQDLRIDVYRASGAGGQHVNTTDSAVRITHIPSGVVVCCQDERSQHKNKAKAMKMLKSRLYEAQQEREAAVRAKERKEQVGRGMRAEKVRTYNYPQNRVTDHQVGLTLKKLDMVMEGSLGEIVEALRDEERAQRSKQAFEVSV